MLPTTTIEIVEVVISHVTLLFPHSRPRGLGVVRMLYIQISIHIPPLFSGILKLFTHAGTNWAAEGKCVLLSLVVVVRFFADTGVRATG